MISSSEVSMFMMMEEFISIVLSSERKICSNGMVACLKKLLKMECNGLLLSLKCSLRVWTMALLEKRLHINKLLPKKRLLGLAQKES